MKNDIKGIQKLVGDITHGQLRYVDCFVGANLGLFMPSVGPCFYSLTKAHTHPAYMFVLPFDDYCRLHLDDKTITPEHGKIYALSPCIPHHEIVTHEFSRYIAIFIDKAYFEAQLQVYPPPDTLTFKGASFRPSPKLLPLLKEFMIEYENKLPGHKAILKAMETAITHTLIRDFLDCRPSSEQQLSFRMEVSKVIEYLHLHFDKKVSVEEMAKLVALSPSHFSRLFKHETGTSPLSYLILVRLNKAKKMLRAGDRSVTEIAFLYGFNSASHFSACFYKKFSIPPSHYAKNLN